MLIYRNIAQPYFSDNMSGLLDEITLIRHFVCRGKTRARALIGGGGGGAGEYSFQKKLVRQNTNI